MAATLLLILFFLAAFNVEKLNFMYLLKLSSLCIAIDIKKISIKLVEIKISNHVVH